MSAHTPGTGGRLHSSDAHRDGHISRAYVIDREIDPKYPFPEKSKLRCISLLEHTKYTYINITQEKCIGNNICAVQQPYRIDI